MEKIRLIEGFQFNETPQTLTKGNKTFNFLLEKTKDFAEIFKKNSSDDNFYPEFKNSKSINETNNPITR